MIKIEIKTDNAAFEGQGYCREIAWILRSTVGFCEFTEGE
jgi:hypothetical protein